MSVNRKEDNGEMLLEVSYSTGRRREMKLKRGVDGDRRQRLFNVMCSIRLIAIVFGDVADDGGYDVINVWKNDVV